MIRLSGLSNHAEVKGTRFQVTDSEFSNQVQRTLNLTVSHGTTAREVVALSGIVDEFGEIDVANCPIGVFGKQVEDAYPVSNDDRVEIYRPLINEPRETRRRLADKQR